MVDFIVINSWECFLIHSTKNLVMPSYENTNNYDEGSVGELVT